ncbi:MAG: Ig-like domain-containing protein [Bacilli bacterium]
MSFVKNKRNKILGILFLILGIVIFICLGVDEKSYAFDDNSNYLGDYILNPAWIEYMDLSEREKSSYEVIPEQFIYRYKKEDSSFIRFFSLKSDYPEYYNLNDDGYSSAPDNQSSLGICWAFAAMSSIESNMLKTGLSSISNPIKFSVRQLDYASVHRNYVQEKFNPYYVYGRTSPGSGGIISTGFTLMETGISPVTTDKYGVFNVDRTTKTLNQTFNLEDVEYVVDSYVNYGATGNYTTDEEREAWVSDIKNHIMNYGSVAIGLTGSTPASAGSCIYVDDASKNFILNVSGECNPPDKAAGHAMAIIGFDDNYSYQYCRLESSTTSDLTDCENIVSGKGAFILKNSWGEYYPYPYMTYESNVDGAYGVTGVSLKNWDKNYDRTKEYDASYEHKISTITYYKSDKVKEKLKKISFYSNSRSELAYQIYLSHDGSDNYVLLDTVITNAIGLNSIYVDDLLLSSDKFSIKITSDDGYVDKIFAFTENADTIEDVMIDTVIKTGNEYEVNATEFTLYSMTENVSNGDIVQYKLVNELGEDVTSLFSIHNNFNLNNEVRPTITINDVLPTGKLTLQTIYNDEVKDSDHIVVNALKNLWSGGSGSVDDPYLITSVEDFVKIFTSEDYMKVHYKLVEDLDFSSVGNWNIGVISNYQTFSGSFDGDHHIISGLSGNSNLPALFYSLDGAVIKNLIFSDIYFNIVESGWGNLLAILAYRSTLEDIVITKSVEIDGNASYAGGLIGTAYNSKFLHIANYANIKTGYEYNGKASGVVNEAYGSEINECYNYGDITAVNSIVGGIVGYLGVASDTYHVGNVKNTYNFGNIITDLAGAGIVGSGESSIVENSYNVFSKDVNSNVANIVGASYGMVIKNSYYLSSFGGSVAEDRDSTTTFVNVMGKTVEQLKDQNTYLNFDFDSIWSIDSQTYPYLTNFHYLYLTDIEVSSELKFEVGETKKIEIKFIPSNANNLKVSYEVVDESIITVSNNGVVTALKKGTTTLRIRTLDGSNIVKEIPIIVIIDQINLDDYRVIEDSFIQIKENYNIDRFIASIYQGDNYEIKVSSKNQVIGTGDKISIFNKDGTKAFEYAAVVLGDITGNGLVDVGDVAKLYQHLKGAIDMDREFKLASDVYQDSVLELNDVAKLYQYVRKGIESLEG